jgi:hypothetical protein
VCCCSVSVCTAYVFIVAGYVALQRFNSNRAKVMMTSKKVLVFLTP